MRFDCNAGAEQEGAGYIQINLTPAGLRCSAATAFLGRPRRERWPNLRIATGAVADRLAFDSPAARCTGIHYQNASGGSKVAAVAWARREVVLCAGAIGSPSILQRSGVGCPASLAAAGVQPAPMAAGHLPAVGANLHDHLQVITSALRWLHMGTCRSLSHYVLSVGLSLYPSIPVRSYCTMALSLSPSILPSVSI